MYVNLLFWFQFFCGFSGSTMSNSWVLIFFNLLFTSAPPLLYGILDKNVSGNTLLSLPQLYKTGQNNQVRKDPAILYDLLLHSLGFCSVQLQLASIFFYRFLQVGGICWHLKIILKPISSCTMYYFNKQLLIFVSYLDALKSYNPFLYQWTFWIFTVL